jgi:probable HAF family extracellular repeat protein
MKSAGPFGVHMQPRNWAHLITAVLLAGLPMAPGASAQSAASSANHIKSRYKVIDLGTLGGPISYGSVNGDGFRLLNDGGAVASYADLAAPDPNASFFCYDADCFQAHASLWKHGIITDLGALPENNNSAAGSINSRGWATGQSQSSAIDPVFGIPEFRGVLWKQGQIIDLGTLDGGTESLGIYVNDAGQVIGFSTVNTVPDPVGFGFQTHSFIWQNGQMLDIGTLGGDDTLPGASCSNPPEGMVWGNSTTSETPNPDTGIPTLDPFLWDHGKMIDLGTLGGTNGFAQCANQKREVIGNSNLAGDATFHAFFWRGGVMTDLGTLGGDDSEAIWFNDQGVIAGSADLPTAGIHDAVRWKDGQILDLGTVDGDACSRGRAINARGQIVGGSSDCHDFLHGFVWEDGGPMIDLNTVIPAGSGLQITNAFNINDRGEILAKSDPVGVTPIDDEDLGHLVLLVPCDEGQGDCVNVPAPAAIVFPSIRTLVGQQPTARDAMWEWHGRFTARRGIGSER